MPPPELAIPVRELDAAGKHYVFALRAPWIRGQLAGQDVAPAGPDGELDVRVSRSGHDVVVHGSLRAKLTVPCARCLEPAVISIDERLSVLMVPRHALAAPSSKEYEFGGEEADVLPYEGDTVVLDDLVRDELLLEIPMIPLCSDDCPGISPGPADGAGRENSGRGIDPRLLPLARFAKKDKE